MQVPGPDEVQVSRHGGDGPVDFLTPAAASGQHKGWRVGQFRGGRSPAGDQGGYVLARLQRAEVGDIRPAMQAEAVRYQPHLSRVWPVK